MITKSSGLVALVVSAFTLPLIFAFTDFVKSLEPCAFGPIPVHPEPLQAACWTGRPIVPSVTFIVKFPPALRRTFSTP